MLYVQSTGGLYWSTGELLELCYSGRGAGFNCPAMQEVKNFGPVPVGLYTFGPLEDHIPLGRDVMKLIPFLSNQMFGRDGFYCHGDEIANPGLHLASDGCIIMSRLARLKIANSKDHLLKVIARPAPSVKEAACQIIP